MKRPARIVSGPVPQRLGDQLTAPVAANSTVLPVGSAVEFDETPGKVVVVDDAGTQYVLDYLRCTDAPPAVVLAGPTPAALPADARVDVWNETTDSPVVEYVADVIFDDQVGGEPVPAVVHGSLVDRLRGDLRGLVGTAVTIDRQDPTASDLDDDDTELYVIEIDGAALDVDATYARSPLLFATQTVDAPQESSQNVTLNFTTVLEQYDITPNGDGRFIINTPGVYQVIASAAFAIANLANPGARVVYSTFEISGANSTGQAASVPGDGSTIASVQAVALRRLPAGAIVGMACRQNSGATLDRLGNPNGSRTSLTIAMVQP